ncbi:MAG: hypothetical protein ACSHX0_10920 [Akkermansiaceae bacterium]
MSKQNIILQLTEKIRHQLKTMTDAAKASHEASTGEEAKAESKYDTRGLEASYLADAQAEQCKKLEHSLHIFENLQYDDLPEGSAIEPSALIETELEGTIAYYLLTPCAGGITLEYEGFDLTTLTPEAPLYQNLLGKNIGERLDTPAMMILDIR